MANSLERIWAMNQTASDRPDLLDRMYSQQMKIFMKDLTQNNVMGKSIIEIKW